MPNNEKKLANEQPPLKNNLKMNTLGTTPTVSASPNKIAESMDTDISTSSNMVYRKAYTVSGSAPYRQERTKLFEKTGNSPKTSPKKYIYEPELGFCLFLLLLFFFFYFHHFFL